MSSRTIENYSFNETEEAISNQTAIREWLTLILQKEVSKRQFDAVTEIVLVLCYSSLITFGTLGNGLVIYVVIKNPSMRTPRNIFIINLAISDLSLCVFTQPLNLYLLLFKHWSLGEFLCKFITMAQGTNLFVSTISITAIALDRFQVIVYPNKDSMKKIGAAIALSSIWLISFLMASPALLFSVLHRRVWLEEEPTFFVYVCMEDITLVIEKQAYSVAQMVVQYLLPFFILSVAHLRICNKLRYRMVPAKSASVTSTSLQRKHERRNTRKRKTNLLLGGIAIVFALSWMPLNVMNLLIDFKGDYFRGRMDVKLAYAICHLLMLCSACLNPVLYGWLNDNFRTEFIKMLCCPCCQSARNRIRQVSWSRRSQNGVPVITLTKASQAQSLSLFDGDEYGRADIQSRRHYDTLAC
ncbi:unnamed protein product [Candidula unifasciata]|uniref:G-protein coupled receptors family 1 profile domain-containing protein n=1 Tax=Candidula unifasciata TaxID=100452 RepID=A0A8S3ZX19_9EUPU|nr:unnamed protein product [Candidula unifasciata]